MTIHGKVIDERTGETIIGANISVKGTTINSGTATNLDGVFDLLVPSLPATITVSYIGYRTQEIDVYEAPKETLVILLVEDLNALNEVVVVGYGTQKRSELTGSVSSIKPAELLQTPLVSLDQGLGGRAAGVQVVQTSGMPGAVASIRVRGSSSLQGGNEPLYIIDGFPVYSGTGFGSLGGKAQLSGLSTVNPSDIESIEILKDASATAIYGARAANGVVLITTKGGKKGRDHISFESSFGFSSMAKKFELLDAQEYAALVNEAYVFDGNGKPFYDAAQMVDIAKLGRGTDWQDEIFRTGFSSNYQLSFSGGDEKTNYAVSGNYLNQTGIIIGSGIERFSARLNLDRRVLTNFTIGVNLSVSHTISDGVATDSGGEGGVVTGALRMNPILPVYSDPETGVYTQVNTPGILSPNPVATALEQTFDNAVSRLLGNAYLQWELLKGLTLKVTAGSDVQYHKYGLYTPSVIYQSNGQASASVQSRRTINWLNENTLTWNKAFGDHALNLLGGFSLQQNNSDLVGASSSNYVNDVMEYNNLGAGSVLNIPASDAPQWNLLSYLARVNYTLKDKYLFSVNARIDGSSRFGTNNKYGFFPSVAAGWKLSDESFWEPVKGVVSNLKLRGSYGITGNTEIGVYESLATLGNNNWVIGNKQVTGFYPNKIPNPDLKWEKTEQLDFGIDAGFWNDRVRLTADYYHKKTTDLLYNVAITGVSGYTTMLKNIGSLENKGFEFAVESNNLTGRFKWSTAFNIAFNKNKVLALGGETYKEMPIADDHLKTGSIRRLVVGEPIGVIYGYRFDGIFQNEEEVARQTASPSPLGVGFRRYKDLNNDNKVDATNDREILGDTNPDFFGGLANNLAYKGFELNTFFQYTYGNEIFNYNAIELGMPTGGQNVYKELLNRWTPTNPSNIYPRASTNRAVLVSDRFVEDGSYLRLKTVSLSYSFPTIKHKHIQGIQLYITGQNLVTWTNYTGYDPEVSYRGASTLEAGEDFGGYPQSRSFLIGLKLDIK
ncbi:SusC/RagA family TonB-linked outer membrane protein [Bacteroidia bacterium]|nr:SusC/RagA family TonB-linked outer membrane protein [Bacteroidia bacterium]